MACYKVFIRPSAARELRQIPRHDLRRIVTPPGSLKLERETCYRLRQGDWRVLYEIDRESKTVDIVKVGSCIDKARLPFPRSQHRWQPCFPVQRRSFGPGSGCRVQEVFGRRMRITTLAVARSGTVPAAPRGCNHKVEAALRHHLVAVNDQRSVISLASLGDAESYLLSIDCNYPRRK